MDKLNQSLALLKLISQFKNKESIPDNGAKFFLYNLNSIAIGVNVQMYTKSNKVMSVQNRLHVN